MDENKLKADITELLKKHAKPREDVPEAVREYFTEDKVQKRLTSHAYFKVHMKNARPSTNLI